MPDQRQHRGANPRDTEAFAPDMRPRLCSAYQDLNWLLSRGYAERLAGTLVGDRHALTERQRIAVRRCSCADSALEKRRSKEILVGSLGLLPVAEIDGYNVLTTVEAALAGGVLLVGRDGCYRDMASMHGSFKKVAETDRAIDQIGETLSRCGFEKAIWYLNSPVSNSGRLKQTLLEFARAKAWNWQVQLVPDPDKILAASTGIVATADSAILDRAVRWFNLARLTVQEHVTEAWIWKFDSPV